MQENARVSSLTGAVALVTGGGSGIGLGIARRLVEEGAVVTICGRTEGRLADAAAELGCSWVVTDVTDERSLGDAIDATSDDHGGLDIVVANAGGTAAVGPLPLVTRETFDGDLHLNVTGTFLTIKHAAPRMAANGGGSIVAISSIAGCLTHRMMAPYSVSKAGLEMLVRNAADELGAYGIRVNAVRPGLVPTDTSDPLASHDATRGDYLAQMPLQRLGSVDDIASAVRFLVGPESGWITGQCISVDGGHSLRRGPDLGPLLGVHFADALEQHMGRSN